MRVYSSNELGDLSSYSLCETASPRPEVGQMLISVEATALGFVDQLIMRGLYQVRPPVPFVPGGEIVGRIEALGVGVEGFKVGQRIACWQFGAGLADKAIVEARYGVHVPAGVTPAKAAALLLDYLTAYYGLFDRGGLKPGQTLLVTGASGGVGSAAVHLASTCGAEVIALASGAAKQAMVRKLGAAKVIDYTYEGWRDELKYVHPAGVNMVFDPVGGDLFQLCFRSLAKKGRHLVVGFASGDGIPSLPANLPLLKSGELVGVDARYLWEQDTARTREILSIILSMADMQKLDPPISQVFGLEEACEAIEFVMSKDRLGKVVVVP